MSQNPRDQINKAAWTLFEGVKDTVETNLTLASRAGQIEIKGDALAKLLLVVKSSIEEGYHKGYRSFTRISEEALNGIEEAAWTQGSLMAPRDALKEKPKKK